MENKSNFCLEQLFKACDTNGKGFIGPFEFSDLCLKFGISTDDSNLIFADLDGDGNGEIDFVEFSNGFSDFLSPGTKRGSIAITANKADDKLITANGTEYNGNGEIKNTRITALKAWRQFTHNVGEENYKPFLKHDGSEENLAVVMEEVRKRSDPEIAVKLEKAVTHLIGDISHLQDEYKSLEISFKKERESHAKQLSALGEELDSQLTRAKTEAREEAQKQMELERKKIAKEMENKLSELSAQLKTFHKVEKWLTEEAETRERQKSQVASDSLKLNDVESENKNLRNALVEAQMAATLLKTQLTKRETEYVDLIHDFNSEKCAADDYKSKCDLMKNQISVLSDANRILSDTNDQCLSFVSINSNSSAFDDNKVYNNNNFQIGQSSQGQPEQVLNNSQVNLNGGSSWRSNSSGRDIDSGRETLLEESRMEEINLNPTFSPAEAFITSIEDTQPNNNSYLSAIISESTDENPMLSNISERSNNSKSSSKYRKSRKHFQSTHAEIQAQINNTVTYAEPQRTFKVILAGDASVGKTSFIDRVCNGHFSQSLSSTIGVDFRVKAIHFEDKYLALQLWDTAGQERFRSLTKSYFRRADGVILMYDVSIERSFVNIRNWIQDIEESAGRKIPIILCGNKVDLRDGYLGVTCVKVEEGHKLARQCGAIFIETSPKSGENVVEALLILTREMCMAEDAELEKNLKLDVSNDLKKKSCCSSSNSNSNVNSS